MEKENPVYKTAELVRDASGCYYFICLQCGEDFENLEDTVDHIEKYFREPDNNVDNVDALTPMTFNESDWMLNESDVDTVLSNIKKESFEEYEDYKLAIPEMYQQEQDMEPAEEIPIYCPICASTHQDISLESHLMKMHHRPKKHAKVYECKICGRNTFTRSYDLERHHLNVHAKYSDNSAQSSSTASALEPKLNGDSNENSVLFNIQRKSNKVSTDERMQRPNVTIFEPTVNGSMAAKRFKYVQGEVEASETQTKVQKIDNNKLVSRPVKGTGSKFCPICQTTFSKNDTLESHLICFHRRNKQYAKVYECKDCGKNSFTRPYDLRRHELIHLVKKRKVGAYEKSVRIEPIAEKAVTIVPVAKRSPIKEESKSPVKKIPTPIQTTNPETNGVLCAICNEKFDSYLDVTVHLKFAHNEKRIYKCSHASCTADPFSNSFLLHRHEISHSEYYRNVEGNNLNRSKCIFCRKSFNKKWNLMKHEKRHLSDLSKQ